MPGHTNKRRAFAFSLAGISGGSLISYFFLQTILTFSQPATENSTTRRLETDAGTIIVPEQEYFIANSLLVIGIITAVTALWILKRDRKPRGGENLMTGVAFFLFIACELIWAFKRYND